MNRFFSSSFVPLVLFIVTLVIYIFFAGRLVFNFPTTDFNYYSLLTEAFLHGKLYFTATPRSLNDLSIIGNHIYMYWGPGATLLVFPFIMLFGINFSDALYTAIIASFAPIFLYLCIRQLEKMGVAKLTEIKRVLLCIFFTFGSVFFYISVNGAIWFTSQSIATLYILISLFFLLRYQNKPSLLNLVTSTIFLCLTISTRNTYFLYLPVFLTVYLIYYLKSPKAKILATHLLTLSLIFTFFIIVIGIYNYSRFSSFFESGFIYQNTAQRYLESSAKFGYLNIVYLPHNFYYMFLNIPQLISQFPFFAFDPEGNSILFTSPILLLLILVPDTYFWRSWPQLLFNSAVIFSIILMIIFLLIFLGTGWWQFGYRYTLDVIPLFVLLLAQIATKVKVKLLMFLVSLSVLVNLLGTLWFLNIKF